MEARSHLTRLTLSIAAFFTLIGGVSGAALAQGVNGGDPKLNTIPNTVPQGGLNDMPPPPVAGAPISPESPMPPSDAETSPSINKTTHASPDTPAAPPPKRTKKEKDKEEADHAIAIAKAHSIPPRTGAWTLGFDFRQLNIKPDDGRYKEHKISPDVNVGYVTIRNTWWFMGRVHLVFGPTSEHFPNSPTLDTSGYGYSFTYGKSLFGDLRKSSGDYGAELGLEAFQVVGRSFESKTLSDGSLSSGWVMRTSWTALSPALYATFLQPSRPQGNRPEWLVTRIEGYRVSLGVVIPVQTSWDLSWTHDQVGQGGRGKWKGAFGLASLTAWLGI
ncbi:MAG: hypothetical protein H7249_15695 [Chitinophagaceae bacterium]|nr:hypothetical protein [Oligoflexus sp.]